MGDSGSVGGSVAGSVGRYEHRCVGGSGYTRAPRMVKTASALERSRKALEISLLF